MVKSDLIDKDLLGEALSYSDEIDRIGLQLEGIADEFDESDRLILSTPEFFIFSVHVASRFDKVGILYDFIRRLDGCLDGKQMPNIEERIKKHVENNIRPFYIDRYNGTGITTGLGKDYVLSVLNRSDFIKFLELKKKKTGLPVQQIYDLVVKAYLTSLVDLLQENDRKELKYLG